MKPGPFQVSPHAEEELQRRGIPRAWLEQTLTEPEQTVPGFNQRTVYQRRFQQDGSEYLLRAIVDTLKKPATVVTVYRTSKLSKYWSPP